MYRERLTITLDSHLLQAVDSLIDQETLRNRSQTIEYLLKEGLALHELHHAFLFLEPSWKPETLSDTITLLYEANVRHLFITTKSSQPSLAAELALQLHQYQEQHPSAMFSYDFIPGDFGSGGAVILQQAALGHPFFLTWITDRPLGLPSLVPLYAFHRQHHQPLTVLMESGQPEPRLALANPQIVPTIPPGLSSLRHSVFPALRKNGTVRGYIIE